MRIILGMICMIFFFESETLQQYSELKHHVMYSLRWIQKASLGNIEFGLLKIHT